MLLAEPMNFLDEHDGGSVTWRVDWYQDGSTVIFPNRVTPRHRHLHQMQHNLPEPPPVGHPTQVEVPALRLFGARLDQSSISPYLDVSSKRLRADLLARFQNGLSLPVVLTLQAHGFAPRKEYSVEVVG